MQKAYLMAGKRFQVKDWAELEAALGKYGLVTNKEDQFNARKFRNTATLPSIPTKWYNIEHSYGDYADFDDENGYDVCVGIVIAYAKEVEETELSTIEKILSEVREDIPDAKLLV